VKLLNFRELSAEKKTVMVDAVICLVSLEPTRHQFRLKLLKY